MQVHIVEACAVIGDEPDMVFLCPERFAACHGDNFEEIDLAALTVRNAFVRSDVLALVPTYWLLTIWRIAAVVVAHFAIGVAPRKGIVLGMALPLLEYLGGFLLALVSSAG
jgi:hypothetical protein